MSLRNERVIPVLDSYQDRFWCFLNIVVKQIDIEVVVNNLKKQATKYQDK